MAKSPKARKEQSALSIAVDFLKHCKSSTPEGQNLTYADHIMFTNGYAYRFDGILACGYPCQDEIDICPEFEPFAKGLRRVGSDFKLLVSGDHLRIVGSKLQVHVYAMASDEYMALPPNPPFYAVDNKTFREALAKIVNIASDTSEHVLTSSIRFGKGFATATNRFLIAQVVTGTYTDIDLVIPKRTIATLLKTSMPIISIGYDENSVTFWFDNGAFMRSQLYKESWPDTADSLLVENVDEHTNIPREFFEAVEAVSDLADTSVLHFTKNGVQDVPNETIATSYKIAYNDIPTKLSADELKLIAGHANKCMINNRLPSGAPAATFFGDGYRATLSHMMPDKQE